MSKQLKSNLLKYGITILVGALMVYAVLQSYGYAEAATEAEKILILSNAFTIPGVILIMLCALVWVSNEGFFYGISYAVSYAVKLLIPGPGKQQRYGDYVEERRAKGKATGYGFLFFVGAGYLVVAIIFTVLFYQIR